MKLSALLTSAGVNISVCVVLFILYSLLRKQPTFVDVYFSQRFARVRIRQLGGFNFERFVPSPSWILKAWEASDEEILSAGGLDALVLVRMIVFSFRIFSIATMLGLFLVLPLNYFGQDIKRQQIRAESLEVFTIVNVEPGSRWFWVHCLALYIITCSACLLLYFEYRSISKKRLAYFTSSNTSPSYFTVLVRSIPKSKEESYSQTLEKFFMNYYASSYLSHQIVYRSGSVQKLLTEAEEVLMMLKTTQKELCTGPDFMRCGLCGGATSSFKMIPYERERDKGGDDCNGSGLRKKESAAALVFFRNRYAALVASQGLQTSNPMSWVTDPAPEPDDMYWSNICIPYRLLWIRKIALLVASLLFVAFFLVPVSLTQSLVHLDKLQKTFPFLRGILKRPGVTQLVTGYLPSVVLILFSYIVPPLMMLFSKMEGSISRSGRKRSACIKVLYFFIWNVFFGNIVSGSVFDRLNKIFKDVNNLLSTAVPSTATFFVTYVLTSGWASLSVELLQPFGLICRLFSRFILRKKDASGPGTLTFPYHTEVPRILLFGLFGFAYAILAPLILPFLVVYFSLAYLVYRNQILNVYVTKYQTGGTYWPIVHNTTIFSMVLMQIIALAVFGFKKSSSTSSFTIPLIICTLLFHEYCRQRFEPLFKDPPAQILVEMDRVDEEHGRLKEVYQQLTSAYCQFKSTLFPLGKADPGNVEENMSIHKVKDVEDVHPGSNSSCTSVEIKGPHLPLSHTSLETKSPHLQSPHASLEIRSPPHLPSSSTSLETKSPHLLSPHASLEIRSPPRLPSSSTSLETNCPHLLSPHASLEIRSPPRLPSSCSLEIKDPPHLPSSRTSLEIKSSFRGLSSSKSLEITSPHLPSPRTSLEISSSHLPSPRTSLEIKSPHYSSPHASSEINSAHLPSPRTPSEIKSPLLPSPRESLEIKTPHRASPRKSSEIRSPLLPSPHESSETKSPRLPLPDTSLEIEESCGK